jgi:hypothetical protein
VPEVAQAAPAGKEERSSAQTACVLEHRFTVAPGLTGANAESPIRQSV